MPYTVTKYPHGTFSWCDFFSTDIDASKKFFSDFFGWTYKDMPTGEGRPDYTMFYLDGNDVAGGSPGFAPDMPSFWSSYVSVTNVDEVASRVESLGGKITMPVMDVLDSGRMVTIQDPTGANVSLWQPKKHIGAHVVNIPGAMSWNELYTKDVEKAKDFYGKLLGWKFEVNKNGGNYTVIKNNGRSNGGIIEIVPEFGNMPPNWTVYFSVKSVEESVKKAKALNGKVWLDPKDIAIGKIAMISDPAGAAFIIIEMVVPPDEWVD